MMPATTGARGRARSAASSSSDRRVYYFTGIDKCRFRKPVVPGDQLVFEVELVAKRKAFAKIKGRALVDDEVVCEAEMMSALADR